MDNQLAPDRKVRINSNSPDRRVNNSINSGISRSQSNNRSYSIQELSSMYKDTTFGTSKRMHIPTSNKIGFVAPSSSLDKKLGIIPKSSRQMQLSDYGIDSPSPAKYDALHSIETLKTNRGGYSFRKAPQSIKIVDPDVSIANGISSITPGPGIYNPKLKGIGEDGPKFSIFKQKSGYSYLPNVMDFPSPTKYYPKPTYVKRHLVKDGLGILRAERDYSYINDQKTPGPANYDTEKNARLPNTLIFGKIDRAPRHFSIDSKKETPGPGHYELQKPLLQKHDWDHARNKAQHFRELRRVASLPKSTRSNLINE